MCLSCFGYRVGEEAVEIRFLGIKVRKIPFSNIDEAWLGSKGSVGEVWTFFKWWGLVTLKKKTGFLKYVTLAPKDPSVFYAEVKKKIAA